MHIRWSSKRSIKFSIELYLNSFNYVKCSKKGISVQNCPEVTINLKFTVFTCSTLLRKYDSK